MAPLAAPKRPQVNEPTETSARVTWEPIDGATGYVDLSKEVPEEWSEALRTTVGVDQNCTVVVEGLSPTSTFQFKLIAVNGDGESDPSDETVIDTLVANCGPNDSKSKCTLL